MHNNDPLDGLCPGIRFILSCGPLFAVSVVGLIAAGVVAIAKKIQICWVQHQMAKQPNKQDDEYADLTGKVSELKSELSTIKKWAGFFGLGLVPGAGAFIAHYPFSHQWIPISFSSSPGSMPV